MLSEEFVRELHRRLFGEVWEWAGTFRLTEKNIGVDPIQVGVRLRALLDDARYWAEHGAYPPLEAAARFHHRLVQIHCFANGNGHHARIMADEYLRDHFGHPLIDWAAGNDLSMVTKDATPTSPRCADGHDHGPILKFVGTAGG
ncbi:mobile mystery protein B [Alteraurantiacibacter aquimixticola]|uniref:mobile mystery protein B n=1 Tax=Alteraurantiacibacter aquimixticola TaxID=2489173 RepID=UPI001FEAE748|nr:mobile mystery protein B [Alteraurantiacibacter aquimixticola]